MIKETAETVKNPSKFEKSILDRMTTYRVTTGPTGESPTALFLNHIIRTPADIRLPPRSARRNRRTKRGKKLENR